MDNQTKRKVEEIKSCYYPDGGDRCVGREGQYIDVSYADFTLLEIIEAQQEQINALQHDVSEVVALRMDLAALKTQLAEFQACVTDAVPGACKPIQRDGFTSFTEWE